MQWIWFRNYLKNSCRYFFRVFLYKYIPFSINSFRNYRWYSPEVPLCIILCMQGFSQTFIKKALYKNQRIFLEVPAEVSSGMTKNIFRLFSKNTFRFFFRNLSKDHHSNSCRNYSTSYYLTFFKKFFFTHLQKVLQFYKVFCKRFHQQYISNRKIHQWFSKEFFHVFFFQFLQNLL